MEAIQTHDEQASKEKSRLPDKSLKMEVVIEVPAHRWRPHFAKLWPPASGVSTAVEGMKQTRGTYYNLSG